MRASNLRGQPCKASGRPWATRGVQTTWSRDSHRGALRAAVDHRSETTGESNSSFTSELSVDGYLGQWEKSSSKMNHGASVMVATNRSPNRPVWGSRSNTRSSRRIFFTNGSNLNLFLLPNEAKHLRQLVVILQIFNRLFVLPGALRPVAGLSVWF